MPFAEQDPWGRRLVLVLSATTALLAFLFVEEAALRADEAEDAAAGVRPVLVAGHLRLAQECQRDGLVEEALREAGAVLALDPDNTGAADVQSQVRRPWIFKWDDALHKKYLAYVGRRDNLRKEAAKSLVAAGDVLAKSGRAEAADAVWRRALEQDPDCREAHEKLKEVQVQGAGWVSRGEAEKRAKGLLPFGEEWLPAREVEKRRSVWADGWEVAGAHFQVKSNHSRAGARDVLDRAEELYTALTREFAGVIDPPKADGPMRIYYFASRADLDEHNREAHGDRPGLRKAPGFFSNEDRIGHFFPISVSTESTLQDLVRHEGTHQIAYAMMPAQGNPTTRPHFWVWEGLACYFESAEVRDGKVILGNPKHTRLRKARELAASGNFVPFAEFFQYDQRRVSGHYPQAAGMVDFFMNAGNGRYREPFIEYCRVVHAAHAVAETYTDLFKSGPEAAQREWVEYMTKGK